MIRKLIIGLCIGLFCSYSSIAAPICDSGSCTLASWNNALQGFEDCKAPSCDCTQAGVGTTVYTCLCSIDTECGDNNMCKDGRCQECKTCSNCASTDWVTVNTKYQTHVSAQCSCEGVCTKTTYYRCATGYYGSPTNTSSGCSQCLSPGTSVAGAKSNTDCYIPDGGQNIRRICADICVGYTVPVRYCLTMGFLTSLKPTSLLIPRNYNVFPLIKQELC